LKLPFIVPHQQTSLPTYACFLIELVFCVVLVVPCVIQTLTQCPRIRQPDNLKFSSEAMKVRNYIHYPTASSLLQNIFTMNNI